MVKFNEQKSDKEELLKPKNDVVFQSLFSKKNEYITKEIEEMTTKWRLRSDEKLAKILTDKMEIDIIELNKAKREYNKNENNQKAQWMMFMDNPEGEEVKKIMKSNEGVKEAVVTVRKMSKDEKLRKLAELKEKAIMDEASCYNTGLHEGEKNGKKEAKIEIAKELLKLGMNKKDIIKITKLDEEEIENISKEEQ